MQDKDTKPKTIRFDTKLINEIEKLCEESERDFSKQVQWMLKQYLKFMKESKQ